MLKRAIRTLWIILDEMDRMWLPVERDWRLNERHYGALQGLEQGADGRETRRRAGEGLAPQLRHPAAAARARRPASSALRSRATRACGPEQLPATESLKTTLDRVLPYWNERLAPELKAGRNVLVVAHGNSLRALVKMLDGMSDADIVEFNIPTGVPISYELDDEPEAEVAPLPRRPRSDQGRCGSRRAADREEVRLKPDLQDVACGSGFSLTPTCTAIHRSRM